jgi:hypothetical protein
MEGHHRLAIVQSATTSVGVSISEHKRRGNGVSGCGKKKGSLWCARCRPRSRRCDACRGRSDTGAGRTAGVGEEQRGRGRLGAAYDLGRRACDLGQLGRNQVKGRDGRTGRLGLGFWLRSGPARVSLRERRGGEGELLGRQRRSAEPRRSKGAFLLFYFLKSN